MSRPSFETFTKDRLSNLSSAFLFRELPTLSFKSSFVSNDYLGLSASCELLSCVSSYLNTTSFGSTGSRLLSGNSELHTRFESAFASFLDVDSVLLFNSGYHANTGVISSLVSLPDLILADKHIHASCIDGARLSGATFKRFRHNDMVHLKALLQKYRASFRYVLIVTESLFSMDGDYAPLPELISLKQEYDCLLMVDDAHAIGVLGPDGRGLCYDYRESIDCMVGTFGKAFASMGAYVASSDLLRALFVNTSRSFIYSTALPPVVSCWNLEVLSRLSSYDLKREHLFSLVAEMSFLLPFLDQESSSYIIRFPFESLSSLLLCSQKLMELGFGVLPIRPPTVLSPMLRISLNSTHSLSEIREFCEVFLHVKSLFCK